MPGYDVDPTELFAAQGRVQQAAHEGRAELARLQAQASDVLGVSWRGGAATAFRAGYTEWLDGVETVLASLDLLGRALGDTAGDYARAESGTAAGLSRLAS